MASGVLDSVPYHINLPDNLQLKQSSIDTGCLGVFSIHQIPEGTEFGPYVGKIVSSEAKKTIDRRYSWEVFDLATMTLTHILDATSPEDGNWMRYVNSARYFEEQNIVSTQIGQDVFYKAMKDIGPGEELLTWFKKRRGRKRKSTMDGQDSEIKQDSPEVEDSPKAKPMDSPTPKKTRGRPKSTDSPKQKKPKVDVPTPSIATEKPKRIRKPKIIPDSYEGPFLVPKKSRPVNDDAFEPLKPGQLRRRRKKVAPESTEKDSVESSAEKDVSDATDESSVEKTINEVIENSNKVKKEEIDSENLSAQNKAKVYTVENKPSNYEEVINEVAKRKKRRKKSKEKIETEAKDKGNEENSTNKDNASSQPVSYTNTLIEINNSVNWVYPEKGQEYMFNLEKHMITQGPNGCIYTCDICTGIYKNKFSLKRHYLRNHINYRYLSKADIINCLINLQHVLETERECGMVCLKTEPDDINYEAALGTDSTDAKDSGQAHDENCTDKDNATMKTNNGEMVIDNFNREKVETANDVSDSGPADILPAIEKSDENLQKNELEDSPNCPTNSSETESNVFKAENAEEELNSQMCNEETRNTETDENQINNNDSNIKLLGKPDSEITASNENNESTNSKVSSDSTLVVQLNPELNVNLEQPLGLYRCYTCRKIFDTLQQIKCHTALGHPEEINTKMQYSCDKCHMRFYFKHNLVRHSASHEVKLERKQRKRRKSTVKQEIKQEIKDEPTTPESSSPPVPTDPTEPTGSTPDPVVSESPPLPPPPPVFTDDGLQRNHQCAICQTKFDNLDQLYKHQDLHKDELSTKKCPCQYCGKDFLSVTNMRKHVRFHLGYKTTCRNCPEVFSNVGALRKHIRLSHPEIYKAKQQDKVSQPDRKSCDSIEENGDSQDSDKVEKTGKGLRRKSSRDKLEESDSKSSENKENSEIAPEKYHFEHGISFTADEIDDGGSRFKFSCTVCKKRFSNYVNMCRHRRKAHGNETRPRPEAPKPLPVTRLNPKKPKPLYSESPEEVARFYAGVSHNIATNLNEYLDGKVDSLENYKDHIKVEDYTPVNSETEKDNKPIDVTWEMYNFPPNYKPGKTISFTEIRQEFDIHNNFESHCKSFDSQSDTVNLVSEETESGGAKVRIQGSTILKTDIEPNVKNNDIVIIGDEIKKSDNTSDSRISASCGNSDSSKMDFSDGKVINLLRRKLHKSREECASPFKHIENGEYQNFDDLLIGDIDSPIIPRSQSVSSGISFKRKDLIKNSYINKSENMLDSLENGHDVNTGEKNDVGPTFSPQPLSFMCENLLGLKRKDTVNVTENTVSGSSSLSSLDSTSSENKSGHNGSLFTTLSLAANQKEDERFQSTNQIFRDMKSEYSDALHHSLENYNDIAFGRNGQVACVCAICKKHFRDFDGLLRHHRKKHPASICQFIEVEQGNEIDTLHFSEPSTVGALAVTDPGLDNVSDREVFTCTGCGSVFRTLAKLHIHIVSCTPIYSATGEIKSEKGSKTPIKKKIQNKVKNMLNGGNTFKYKIQDMDNEKVENATEEVKTQNTVETKTKTKLFAGFTGFRTILPKPPTAQLPINMPDSTVKPKQRKIQESKGYNPQNHVRRRDMTGLVDSHQCEACGLKFKTILLLERHVPNCSEKEKFKDLCPMKCPIMDQSLEKLKHVCHYCHKHFTYLKSLVNHLHDFCAAKKQKVDLNMITDDDRVKENDVIMKFKKLEEEKVGSVRVVENGERKKGWQKGVKRRPKRKGHSWTSIKRKKSGNGEMNGELVDTNVDNGLDDESSSGDECDEIDANYDLNKAVMSIKQETSSLKDISDNVENEFTPSELDHKTGIITIAPLEYPDVEIKDSEPRGLENADGIDEVDSGNVLINNTENIVIINDKQHTENIITMEPNSMKISHISEEGELMVNNVFGGLRNDEVKVNETEIMNKDKNTRCDNKTENVLSPVHLDPEESDSLELDITVPTRERSKSFLFQCMGTKLKTSDEFTSSKDDTSVAKEKRFDSGWNKFRKSMKKKLGRSKGKFEVNKDTKESTASKVKENKLLKSFRRTQPMKLEKLFQENSTSDNCSGSVSANKTSYTDLSDTLKLEKENALKGHDNLLSGNKEDPIVSSGNVGEVNENLIAEPCGIEVQSNPQAAKIDDINVSVDLTDEIQIFEIAASGSICFNVHNVKMEKSLLPEDQPDKKGMSPILTNAESCQPLSTDSSNENIDTTSNKNELCKDEFSPAQKTKILGGDTRLKGDNAFFNTEINHGDNQKDNVGNETCVDIPSKTDMKTVTDESKESASLNNENKIDTETLETCSNSDEKILTASDLSNVSNLSNNLIDDETVLGKNEHCIENDVKNTIDFESCSKKEIENNQSTATSPSFVKDNEDKDITDVSANQRIDIEEETQRASESDILVKSSDNNVENNAKESANGDKQTEEDKTSIEAEATPEALEIEPVFESVSEKVKKRKRNASGRQFSEFVTESKNIGHTVKASVVKKTISNSKMMDNEKSRVSEAATMSSMSSGVPKSAKTTKPDGLFSKLTTKKCSASSKSIKDNAKPKISKPAQETTKLGKFSKMKKTKTASPKFIKKKATSPVKSDKPFEVVLSPGERVKMNKRQCRKEFSNIGATYMSKTESISRNNLKKNAEHTKSQAVDRSVKDCSLETCPISNIKETTEATNNVTEMKTNEKSEVQPTHCTDNSSEKADANTSEKGIQKSKSKSKLPRKISKESLAIGAKLAGSSLNVNVSMNETEVKRKRGRPKLSENSKEPQCIPSKIPKFASKDADSLSLSEAVNVKRQNKVKMQKVN